MQPGHGFSDVLHEQLAAMFHTPKLQHLVCPLRGKDADGCLERAHSHPAAQHNPNDFWRLRKNHLRVDATSALSPQQNELSGLWKNHFESLAWMLGALSAQMPATDPNCVQGRKRPAKFAAVLSICTVEKLRTSNCCFATYHLPDADIAPMLRKPRLAIVAPSVTRHQGPSVRNCFSNTPATSSALASRISRTFVRVGGL